MPIFTAEINLDKVNEQEKTVIIADLKRSAFEESGNRNKDLSKLSAIRKIRMIKCAESITDIISTLLRIVRRNGNDFSFTVIRNKH